MNIWIAKIFPVSTVFVFAYAKHSRLNGTIATFSGAVERARGWERLFPFNGEKQVKIINYDSKTRKSHPFCTRIV